MVEIKVLLYLYGFSPRFSDRMENLISIIKEQIKLDADIKVILIHDGVIGLSKKGIMPDIMNELLNLPIKVFVMSPDLIARGLNPNEIDDRVECLNYDNLVDLLAINPNIASWM